MSENLKPGYHLHVRSWENDYDSVATVVISDLNNETDVAFLVDIAEHLKGGCNSLKDFARVYADAVTNFPCISKELDYDGAVPTDNECDLWDEYHDLPYRDMRKQDKKYDSIRGFKDNPASSFCDYFQEIILARLGLQPMDEGYWDFKHYIRYIEKVTVYLVRDIEDVTNQFTRKD